MISILDIICWVHNGYHSESVMQEVGSAESEIYEEVECSVTKAHV